MPVGFLRPLPDLLLEKRQRRLPVRIGGLSKGLIVQVRIHASRVGSAASRAIVNHIKPRAFWRMPPSPVKSRCPKRACEGGVLLFGWNSANAWPVACLCRRRPRPGTAGPDYTARRDRRNKTRRTGTSRGPVAHWASHRCRGCHRDNRSRAPRTRWKRSGNSTNRIFVSMLVGDPREVLERLEVVLLHSIAVCIHLTELPARQGMALACCELQCLYRSGLVPGIVFLNAGAKCVARRFEFIDRRGQRRSGGSLRVRIQRVSGRDEADRDARNSDTAAKKIMHRNGHNLRHRRTSRRRHRHSTIRRDPPQQVLPPSRASYDVASRRFCGKDRAIRSQACGGTGICWDLTQHRHHAYAAPSGPVL